MTDFLSLNKAAHYSKDYNEKIAIYRSITKRAQIDEEFRKSIDMEIYTNSCKAFSHLLAKEPKTSGLRIAILGYKVQLMDKWDPFDCIKGVPGSEECAIYASQELARQGHTVVLYLNPPDNSIWSSPFSNPQWLIEDTFIDNNHKNMYDLVLMWRRIDVHTGRKRGKMVFYWPHDHPNNPPKNIPFPQFDGVCILTKSHWNQYKNAWTNFENIPYTICGNGLVPEQFENPMNITNPYSLGYFSNYSRGLIVLLLIWPEIIKEFPTATLDICYGRETWGTLPENIMKFIIEKIESFKDMGIKEHGKIGHQQLANLMKKTSILAYPNISAGETFCITAIKCQAAGCIPVTTRLVALDETVHPDAPSVPKVSNDDEVLEYLKVLLTTMRRIRDSDPAIIKQEREKYIEFGLRFTWKACTDKWLQLYHKLNEK